MTNPKLRQETDPGWHWPIDLTAYDREPDLRPAEREELKTVIQQRYAEGKRPLQALHRLVHPINDVLHWVKAPPQASQEARKVLLQEMYSRQTTFWSWTHEEWVSLFCPTLPLFEQRYHVSEGARPRLVAIAYLLVSDFIDIHVVDHQKQVVFACQVFGRRPVEEAIQQVSSELLRWGWGAGRAKIYLAKTVCELLLLNRSPRLQDLSLDVLERARQGNMARYLKTNLPVVSRSLASLGYLPHPLPPAAKKGHRFGDPETLAGVSAQWVSWCRRWYETSTLTPTTRRGTFYQLLRVGRWLAERHPDVLGPEQWTRDIAIEYVAAVDRMTVGEWAGAETMYAGKFGLPLSARARSLHLYAIRTFFVDGQEWGWFPRRFDARRYLATPRSLRALIAPDPRIISDDVWAKLLWAGLNLTSEDLPAAHRTGLASEKRESWYPLEMLRALVVVWLFAGLRANEIVRLRLGCIRWQREETSVPGTDEMLSQNAICWLDIPVHKTGTAFTKAVDLVVGEAITEWERVRPVQPASVDPKTGEQVHYLFAYRGQQIYKLYLNRSVIPMLCRKAGLPRADARGNITSHRARSTIATQLYNAREPLSLFDLQEWLGHRVLSSTQAYAKKSPTKVARAYEKAGYFGRNIRTIEVLIDQEAIKSGRASAGEPWRFYDLGHGYCLYEFFDQCPHRMACAKCSFYRPKESSLAQLLEGKGNLLRVLQEIPLNEEERAAIEDGIEAMEHLCLQLSDVPTPAGPTPIQLLTDGQRPKTIIPLAEIRRKR